MRPSITVCLTSVLLLLVLVCKSSGDVARPRIIGGQEATPHSIPYQVGLFITLPWQSEKIFCGGSLLTNVFILTAAHCVDGATEAEIILGAHKVDEQEPTQIRYVSTVFIVHKQWNPFALTDDIAIVRIPRPIEFSAEIQPIRLPKLSDQNKSFAFKTASASGWGVTSDDATAISPELRFAESKITLPLICNMMFFGRIGPNQMCLNGNRGKSICSGDSGGPLVMANKDGEPVLHGISSFGIGFGCEKGWPQVFTKVSKYLWWIYEHTGIPVEK